MTFACSQAQVTRRPSWPVSELGRSIVSLASLVPFNSSSHWSRTCSHCNAHNESNLSANTCFVQKFKQISWSSLCGNLRRVRVMRCWQSGARKQVGNPHTICPFNYLKKQKCSTSALTKAAKSNITVRLPRDGKRSPLWASLRWSKTFVVVRDQSDVGILPIAKWRRVLVINQTNCGRLEWEWNWRHCYGQHTGDSAGTGSVWARKRVSVRRTGSRRGARSAPCAPPSPSYRRILSPSPRQANPPAWLPKATASVHSLHLPSITDKSHSIYSQACWSWKFLDFCAMSIATNWEIFAHSFRLCGDIEWKYDLAPRELSRFCSDCSFPGLRKILFEQEEFGAIKTCHREWMFLSSVIAWIIWTIKRKCKPTTRQCKIFNRCAHHSERKAVCLSFEKETKKSLSTFLQIWTQKAPVFALCCLLSPQCFLWNEQGANWWILNCVGKYIHCY